MLKGKRMFMRFTRKGSYGRALAGAAGIAVSAAMLIAVPAAASVSTHGPHATGRAAAAGCGGRCGTASAHDPHVTRPAAALGQARASALGRARATGKAVPVGALTTGTSSTFANPNGSFTTTSTTEPTRMRNAAGRWENLSAALRRNRGGTLSPAAEPGHLTLSGGGRGPLVTLTGPGGQSLALTLPVTLPAPMVSGPSATYRNIDPGVELTVTARTTGGFSEVFTIDNAAAAAHVRTLAFHTELTGLRLTEDRWGNLEAVDSRTGTVVMAAPPAAIWDSATTAGPAKHGAHRGGGADATIVTGKTSSAAGPGLRAHTGPLAVSLGHSTLTLHTSTAALDGTPAYPVYYAPTSPLSYFSGRTQAFTEVQQGCPTYTYFDSVSQIGVGYNEFDSCTGPMRAYYRVDTSGILDPSYIILSSTLQAITPAWNASPTTRPSSRPTRSRRPPTTSPKRTLRCCLG
jgi:hypothetical protein